MEEILMQNKIFIKRPIYKKITEKEYKNSVHEIMEKYKKMSSRLDELLCDEPSPKI
jgi:hypothetical protein